MTQKKSLEMSISEETSPPQSAQLQLQEVPWDFLQTRQEEQGVKEPG